MSGIGGDAKYLKTEGQLLIQKDLNKLWVGRETMNHLDARGCGSGVARLQLGGTQTLQAMIATSIPESGNLIL